ncbi:MAG: MGMT family protein [Candidatus Methylomirabilales bacterium]
MRGAAIRRGTWAAPGASALRRAGAPARGGGFFGRVYALVAAVPRGRVVTYGQVARLLGAPRSARLVGWAMHGNPHGSRVPCHRVVQQGGSLSPSYCLEDPGRQRRLLEREGVRFRLDGRVDMTAHQWQPQDGPKSEVQRPRSRVKPRENASRPTPKGRR